MTKLKPRYKAALLIIALGLSIYVSLIGARIIKYSGGSFSGLRGALEGAVRNEDVVVVRALLAGGANPNLLDEATGMTPLARAAEAGYLNIASILIESGADPKGTIPPLTSGPIGSIDLWRDPIGSQTRPMYQAAIRHDQEMADLLRRHGAMYREIDAIFLGDTEYFKGSPGDKSILNEGRDFFEPYLFEKVIFLSDADAAKLLLDLGFDPSIELADGRTPIELARDRGEEYFVTLFESHMAKQVAEITAAP